MKKNIFKLFRQTPVPDALKSDFDNRIRETGAQAAPIVALLCATLVPFSIVFDFIIIDPRYYYSFFAVRLACTIICLILFAIAKTGIGKQHGTYIAFFAIIVVGLSSSILIHIVGYDHSYYAMLNIIYLGAMVVPMTWRMCLSACLVVFLFYLVPIPFLAGESIKMSILANNVGFQLETIMVAVVYSHFHMRKRTQQIINEQLIINQRDQISQSLSQISALEKSRRQFIANITHDLKTPLSIIAGHVDLVRTKLEDIGDESGNTLRFINDAVSQSSRLLDSLTSIAMLDSGDQTADMKLYDYAEFMRSFCGRFSIIGNQNKIDFQAIVPHGRMVVRMDQMWMERIVGNLVQNAFKFTPRGGVIRVQVFRKEECAVTEVRDTGSGVPDEKLGLIFERKYQAREEDKKIGFGLGLSIVRDMVRRMGGDISVSSEVGRGSVFRFTIPLCSEQNSPIENEPYTGPERRQSSEKPEKNERRVSWKIAEYLKSVEQDSDKRDLETKIRAMENTHLKGRPTILICEDTPGQVHLLVEALNNEYNLLVGFDGKEGLEKTMRHQGNIDLVISDVRMPNMDGIEFCRNFFADESRRLIPFIFLTAYANEHEQLEGLSFGATDYLQKPFNQRILKEKINHWLMRRTHEVLLGKMIGDLEKKNEMISRFRSIIVHEIRNPLVALSGVSHYLKKLKEEVYGRLSDTHKKHWGWVEKSVHIAQDINNIIDAAGFMEKSVAGSTCQPEPIEAVLSDVMDQAEFFSKDAVITLDNIVPAERKVLCDKTMIRQILGNLIRNGAEAVRESGKAGSVTLRAQTDKDFLVLAVIDTGAGMTAGQIDNLFKYRITTKKDGNGIGLYLSYKLLQLQNGTINCKSEPGKGTTFTVQLPLAG